MTVNSGAEYQSSFVTTSSRAIYANPWIEVIEDKVILPNGTPSIYGKVLFKNLSVGVIPLSLLST